MPLKFSDPLRNARVNQVEIVIGSAATLEIWSGAPPATCAAADAGVLLCTIALPPDWLTVGAAGTKSKAGVWQGTAAPEAGTGVAAAYFRIKSGAVAHCQGTITAAGGGGDMTIDNVLVPAGQPITVTAFSITDGNP